MNHPDSICMMCSRLLLAFAFLLRQWGLDRRAENLVVNVTGRAIQ